MSEVPKYHKKYRYSIENLLDYQNSFILWYFSVLLNIIIKSFSVTILHHDDFEIHIHVHIKAFDDIWRITSHHQFILSFAEPKFDLLDQRMFLVMYFPEVYYLNSDLVLCFVVDSFVDLTKSSFTYFLLYVVFTNGVAREVLFHRAELVVGEAQSMVARLSLCFCHLFMICLP